MPHSCSTGTKLQKEPNCLGGETTKPSHVMGGANFNLEKRGTYNFPCHNSFKFSGPRNEKGPNILNIILIGVQFMVLKLYNRGGALKISAPREGAT